jgi:hypothetical protein
VRGAIDCRTTTLDGLWSLVLLGESGRLLDAAFLRGQKEIRTKSRVQGLTRLDSTISSQGGNRSQLESGGKAWVLYPRLLEGKGPGELIRPATCSG